VKNTERLLGIALAVLALEGCRGPQQHASLPSPQPSTSAHPSSGGVGHANTGHGARLGGYAAGAAAGAMAANRNRNASSTRVLGRGGSANRSTGWSGFGGGGFSGGWHGFGGGFGHSGWFGGG
jgi:hypothetical protein